MVIMHPLIVEPFAVDIRDREVMISWEEAGILESEGSIYHCFDPYGVVPSCGEGIFHFTAKEIDNAGSLDQAVNDTYWYLGEIKHVGV